MSISLYVDGSPAACRATAVELRAMHGRISSADRALVDAREAGAAAWRGLAADAFRRRGAKMLGTQAELAVLVARLATGLDELADALSRVRAEMARARKVAISAGVAVVHDRLPDELGVTDPVAHAALDEARTIAAAARAAERNADAAWTAVLELVPRPEKSAPASQARVVAPEKDGIWDLVERTLPDLPRVPLPHVPEPVIDTVEDMLSEVIPATLPDELEMIKPYTWDAVTASYDQWQTDDDLNLVHRLFNANLRGSATVWGGVGAVALCARLKAPKPVLGACGVAGANAGDKGSKKVLQWVTPR